MCIKSGSLTHAVQEGLETGGATVGAAAASCTYFSMKRPPRKCRQNCTSHADYCAKVEDEVGGPECFAGGGTRMWMRWQKW